MIVAVAFVLLSVVDLVGKTEARQDVSAAVQCNDGKDNDRDGKVDALVELSPNNALTRSVGGNGNPVSVQAAVAAAIQIKGLHYAAPRAPLLRSTGGTGGGNRWNDNGIPHAATLQKTCEVLGYRTYVSSTCLDTERSWRYPLGKCNYHSPGNNRLTRFTTNFKTEAAKSKYDKTWIASIVCRDKIPSCGDGVDNDHDGKIDMKDNGCASPNDDSEIPHDPDCQNAQDTTESPVASSASSSSSSLSSSRSSSLSSSVSSSSSSFSSSFGSSVSSSLSSSSSISSVSSSSSSSSIAPCGGDGAAASTNNLIQNPSLEVMGQDGDPADWFRGGWGTNTTDFTYPAEGRDGPCGAQITVSQYTDGDAKWYFADTAVASGQQYRFSNWYKSTAASSIVVRYTMLDGTQQYFEVGSVPASPEWRQFTATLTPPMNAVSLTVFHLLAATGTLTVDAFNLYLANGGPGPDAFDKGYVSLTFDDGWISHYTNVLPMLNQAGFKGSFYIITGEMLNPDAGDLEDPSSYADLSQVRALQQAGHEISSHTRSHPFLTQLTRNQAIDEIQGSRTDLLTRNFTPVETFAYTYGEYNDSVIGITRDAGFVGARSVEDGFNVKTTDPYVLKVQNVLNTTTAAQIKQWIDIAERDKTWLVLVFHQVIDNPGTYDTSPSVLQDIVNYLKTKNASVITTREGLQKMK